MKGKYGLEQKNIKYLMRYITKLNILNSLKSKKI